ncbi:hypothetical protein CIPAW_07G201200 [Carya illinoinensis]|uniref:DUF676 domain-containing protein n=1 Tax=Carya illinoinensis TaxID=32201 RepID=A0A8T1Q1E6_CARIL|nr:hypothetical protein CIPAW_07G201200 [Carya illinoinensis]
MASVDLEGVSSKTVSKMEVNGGGAGGEGPNEIKFGEKSDKKTTKKKDKKPSSWKLRFGCLKTEYDREGNFDMEVIGGDGERRTSSPTHLVVMVNGLIGSAQNWRFAAKQFLKKYPEDVIVHFIKRHPGVQKISFVGHSLGGLIARYAIAKLYGRDVMREFSQGNGECRCDGSGDPCVEEKFKGKIAGLEPINFITYATPHLGSRGHKQVPLFCGFYNLEKVASRASWFLGKTGKHLFLTDNDDGKPPLLLRMANDEEDLKFMSALRSFKKRVAYSNIRFDQLVGWSTSSLRRRDELPKHLRLSRGDKYPHVVNVETAETSSNQQEIPLEAKVNGHKNIHLEEEMLRGLTKVSWDRVDVSFRGSKQRYLAHSTIQVKTFCINSDGADVVQHTIDNFLLA